MFWKLLPGVSDPVYVCVNVNVEVLYISVEDRYPPPPLIVSTPDTMLRKYLWSGNVDVRCVHSCVVLYLFIYLFIYYLFIYLLIYLCIYSLIYLFIYSHLNKNTLYHIYIFAYAVLF